MLEGDCKKLEKELLEVGWEGLEEVMGIEGRAELLLKVDNFLEEGRVSLEEGLEAGRVVGEYNVPERCVVVLQKDKRLFLILHFDRL